MKQPSSVNSEENIAFKALLFQMHTEGYSQDAIAAYLNRGKQTINELLKPLQKKKTKE